MSFPKSFLKKKMHEGFNFFGDKLTQCSKSTNK